MRIVEESYLKRTVAQLNSYAMERETYLGLFHDIDAFETEQLQDLTFRGDLAYFEEIGFILSVITSIISKPHISQTGENIILRAELANNVNHEMFQRTMRDTSLWKFQGDRMIPEHVHYHQSIDDLRIYENIFIVMLVKLISAELAKYTDFYASLIETFHGQEQLSLDENNVSVALTEIKKLTKKITYIQNTRFYKEINREPTYLRVVHPTNILLKDRLYNYCFKFYRSLVTYPDKAALLRDFSFYYRLMLMRSLRKLGFALKGNYGILKYDGRKRLLFPKMTFENEFYHVQFNIYQENKGIELSIRHKLVKNESAQKTSHLVLFNPQTSFTDLTNLPELQKEYTTVEAISLWNMAYVEDSVRPVYQNPLSEQGVVDAWLDSKLATSRASASLYHTFCPSCQRSAVDVDDEEMHRCSHCGSVFTFFTDSENKENVWFLKLRRAGYGK